MRKILYRVFLVMVFAAVISGTYCAGASAKTDSSVKRLSDIRVSKKKIAVNVGFYITGQPGDRLTKTQIGKRLNAVKKYADTVRFYGSAGYLKQAYKTAHDMGFKIVGTAWLSGDDTADKKELDALISHCSKGYVSIACVGSETLKRGDLTPKKLKTYMRYVRKRLKKDIPVTTADDTDTLLANPDVCKACDVLMLNAYPYWGGVTISKAAAAFSETIGRARSAYPSKEIIISETGWPTAGQTVGKAKAGASQAKRYFTDIREWSLKNKIAVLWFDAFDEPWKAASEGSSGAHWGLMTTGLKLKTCYKKTAFFK